MNKLNTIRTFVAAVSLVGATGICLAGQAAGGQPFTPTQAVSPCAPATPTHWACPKCGKTTPLDSGARFCAECGTKVETAPAGGAAVPATRTAPNPGGVVIFSCGLFSVDDVLENMNLDKVAGLKVAAAIKPLGEKYRADYRAVCDKRNDLRQKMKAETDKARRRELQRQLFAVKFPSQGEHYKLIKAAICDILPADASEKLDSLVSAAEIESVTTDFFKSYQKEWAEKGVTLSAEQAAKYDALKAKVRKDAARMEVSTMIDSIAGNVTDAICDFCENVMTAEQQRKVGP